MNTIQCIVPGDRGLFGRTQRTGGFIQGTGDHCGQRVVQRAQGFNG